MSNIDEKRLKKIRDSYAATIEFLNPGPTNKNKTYTFEQIHKMLLEVYARFIEQLDSIKTQGNHMNLNEEKNRRVPTAKIVINGEQTYRIGFDDNHIVVSSGSEKHDKQVWLSKELIRWLADNLEVVSHQPPMDLEITIAKKEE